MKQPLKRKLRTLFESLVNIVYPLNCVICKAKLAPDESIPLCFECFSKIGHITPPFCIKCGGLLGADLVPYNICLKCKNNNYYFDQAWASTVYEGVIRECIHLLKYSHRLSIVNLFGKIMINFADKYMTMERFDYIIPIPLHRTKLREREFNQAELLALPIANKFNKRLLKDMISRIKYTTPQSELADSQRQENVRGIFRITRSESLKHKNILIIDDVFTTGSTVNECASLLKASGASIVEVFTLAR